MSVDVRTREDGPAPPVDAQRFFCESLPDAFAEHRERIAPGAARLRLRPLTIETPDASATVFWRGDRAEVAPGAGPDGGVVWQLTDRRSPTSCATSRRRWRCSARAGSP